MSDLLGTVARAISVLRVVAEAKSSVGVKEVSQLLDLPMATTHRLLDLLSREGFIERNSNSRRYTAGPEFFRVSNLVVRKASSASVVQPVLDQITESSSETSVFAAYVDSKQQVAFIGKSDSPQPLRLRVSLFLPLPLEWDAITIAILAQLTPDLQDRALAALRKSMAQRALKKSAIEEQLLALKETGYASTLSAYFPEAVVIAAPLALPPGNAIGSIAMLVPKLRFRRTRQSEYGDMLRMASRRLIGS